MLKRIYSRLDPDEFIELETILGTYLTVESMYHPNYDYSGRTGEAHTLNNFVSLDKHEVRTLIGSLQEMLKEMEESEWM